MGTTYDYRVVAPKNIIFLEVMLNKFVELVSLLNLYYEKQLPKKNPFPFLMFYLFFTNTGSNA